MFTRFKFILYIIQNNQNCYKFLSSLGIIFIDASNRGKHITRIHVVELTGVIRITCSVYFILFYPEMTLFWSEKFHF